MSRMGATMREVEKNEILIDVCPSCKGVWLDRGELDKLMQGVREVREPFKQWCEGEASGRRPAYDERYGKEYDRSRQPDYGDRGKYPHRTYKKKKT